MKSNSMKILIIILAVLISGCGDFTRNYLIGDELPPGDIQSQRIAMETILIACNKAGLSISDFVIGASLEAAEAVIKKYRSIFPRAQNVGPR